MTETTDHDAAQPSGAEICGRVGKGMYVIIRSRDAGCFAGRLSETNTTHRIVTLTDCRRIWYWSGAASLSGMAVCGVSNPTSCKFSAPTQFHIVFGVIEIIPVTVKAQAIIEAVPVWQA